MKTSRSLPQVLADEARSSSGRSCDWPAPWQTPIRARSNRRRVQFGESRPYLAPVAWAAGTIVLLIRGVKLLVLNWRLSLIQLVPAIWIWLTMWDLKQHALRGAPFRHITLGGMVCVVALAVVVSAAAFWCNTVFAFAIDVLPPQIRPAILQANRHLAGIASSGCSSASALAFAVAVVLRINRVWLYVFTLGTVLGVMLVSFVAVPAHILGRKQQKLPPRQAIGRTATGWALSGVADDTRIRPRPDRADPAPARPTCTCSGSPCCPSAPPCMQPGCHQSKQSK